MPGKRQDGESKTRRFPRQAITPNGGLSKEGKINGFIQCFQLTL